MSIKNNQSGIAHLLVAVIIAVFILGGILAWRLTAKPKEKNDGANRAISAEQADPQPSLQNFGLNLSDVDVTTQAVREYQRLGLKGFYVFGDALSGGRINPNFEFASVKAGAKIISATDGMVTFVREQPESADSEVFVQSKDGSMWMIGYDHVTNLAVKRGDSIKAGAVIGEPSMQNNGLRRFEIQINKEENGKTTHICPSTLLAPAVKDTLLAELSQMEQKWESVTVLDLYNLEAQDPVGCLKQTLSSEQAEGR